MHTHRVLRLLLGLLVCQPAIGAEIDPVMVCRQAVADAEVLVSRADVALFQHQVQQLEQLHQLRYASWIEVTSTRSDLHEAQATLAAREEYSAWIRHLVQRLSDDNSVHAQHGNSLFVNFQLPQSQAFLGWLNVNQSDPIRQSRLLDLLAARARLLSPDTFIADAEQAQISIQEESLAKLTKARNTNPSEIKLAALQLASTRAAKAFADARIALHHAEAKQLLDLVEEARHAAARRSAAQIPVETFDEKNPLPYHQWQHAILAYEANMTGEITVTNALQRWSNSTHHASQLLEQQGYVSTKQTDSMHATEQSIAVTAVTVRDRLLFMRHWHAQQAASDNTRSIEVQPEENDLITRLRDIILQTPHLLKMACSVMHEQTLLNARLSGSAYRMAQHKELLAKLNAQTTVNSQEAEHAESMTSLLAGQQQQLEEELRLTRMVLQSLPDLAESQNRCGHLMTGINEQAIRMILLAAKHNHDNVVSRGMNLEQMATRAKRRMADLESLSNLGYASRSEVLAHQTQLHEFLSAAGRHQLEASNFVIEAQLVQAAWSVPEHGENLASESDSE